MIDEAISPLRRRMIEDMTIRKFVEDAEDYIRTIKNFASFLGRSPNTASLEDVRRFQLHLARTAHTRPISIARCLRCGSFSGSRSSDTTSSSNDVHP